MIEKFLRERGDEVSDEKEGAQNGRPNEGCYYTHLILLASYGSVAALAGEFLVFGCLGAGLEDT